MAQRCRARGLQPQWRRIQQTSRLVVRIYACSNSQGVFSHKRSPKLEITSERKVPNLRLIITLPASLGEDISSLEYFKHNWTAGISFSKRRITGIVRGQRAVRCGHSSPSFLAREPRRPHGQLQSSSGATARTASPPPIRTSGVAIWRGVGA